MTLGRAHMMAAALIMEEARHRHGNEFATALATLHLVRAGLKTPSALLDGAIRRLDAQVTLERHLLAPDTDNLGPAVITLVDLMLRSRIDTPVVDIKLKGSRMDTNGRIKAVLMVTYELLLNAIKRSGPDGRAVLSLRMRDDTLTIVLHNSIQETGNDSGTGSGARIVRGIVNALGGSVAYSRGVGNYHARVIIPCAGI